MGAAPELRAFDGVGEAPPGTNLPFRSMQSVAFSLGASLSLYALRRSSREAFKRNHLYALLWRSRSRHDSSSLSAVDDCVAQVLYQGTTSVVPIWRCF